MAAKFVKCPKSYCTEQFEKYGYIRDKYDTTYNTPTPYDPSLILPVRWSCLSQALNSQLSRELQSAKEQQQGAEGAQQEAGIQLAKANADLQAVQMTLEASQVLCGCEYGYGYGYGYGCGCGCRCGCGQKSCRYFVCMFGWVWGSARVWVWVKLCRYCLGVGVWVSVGEGVGGGGGGGGGGGWDWDGCMHASMCVYKCMCVLLGTHARMGVCANACTKHYLQLSLSYLHPNSNNTRVQTIKEIFLCRKGYF